MIICAARAYVHIISFPSVRSGFFRSFWAEPRSTFMCKITFPPSLLSIAGAFFCARLRPKAYDYVYALFESPRLPKRNVFQPLFASPLFFMRLSSAFCLAIDWLPVFLSMFMYVYVSNVEWQLANPTFDAPAIDFSPAAACGFSVRSLSEKMPHSESHTAREKEAKTILWFTNSAPGRPDTTWMVSMSNGTSVLCRLTPAPGSSHATVFVLDGSRLLFKAHIGVKLTPLSEKSCFFFCAKNVTSRERTFGFGSPRVVFTTRSLEYPFEFSEVHVSPHFASLCVPGKSGLQSNSLFSFATNVKFLFHIRLCGMKVRGAKAPQQTCAPARSLRRTGASAESFSRFFFTTVQHGDFRFSHVVIIGTCNADGSFIGRRMRKFPENCGIKIRKFLRRAGLS